MKITLHYGIYLLLASILLVLGATLPLAVVTQEAGKAEELHDLVEVERLDAHQRRRALKVYDAATIGSDPAAFEQLHLYHEGGSSMAATLLAALAKKELYGMTEADGIDILIESAQRSTGSGSWTVLDALAGKYELGLGVEVDLDAVKRYQQRATTERRRDEGRRKRTAELCHGLSRINPYYWRYCTG